jgi:hypothetical protein
MTEYITDDEFLLAQSNYNNEQDEQKANEILKTIFWPYLNNLAFCSIRKELRRRGVLEFYTIDDIDSLTKTVVLKLVNRYVQAKNKCGRYYNKHHCCYSKEYPKTMVYLAVKSTLGQKQKSDREILFSQIDNIDKYTSYDTFEDDVLNSISQS